jgi:hypothetical protein
VEVEASGAHAADVESEGRPDAVGRAFEIVVRNDGERTSDHVEGPAGVAGARAGEALGERRGVEVAHRGREEHGVPAIGDLGRERHVPRPLRAEVDRDLGPVRVQDRAQRLAEARPRPQGKLIMLAVVTDRLLTGDDLAQDIDVLPGARSRP